jgi:hypothetical protein
MDLFTGPEQPEAKERRASFKLFLSQKANKNLPGWCSSTNLGALQEFAKQVQRMKFGFLTENVDAMTPQQICTELAGLFPAAAAAVLSTRKTTTEKKRATAVITPSIEALNRLMNMLPNTLKYQGYPIDPMAATTSAQQATELDRFFESKTGRGISDWRNVIEQKKAQNQAASTRASKQRRIETLAGPSISSSSSSSSFFTQPTLLPTTPVATIAAGGGGQPSVFPGMIPHPVSSPRLGTVYYPPGYIPPPTVSVRPPGAVATLLSSITSARRPPPTPVVVTPTSVVSSRRKGEESNLERAIRQSLALAEATSSTTSKKPKRGESTYAPPGGGGGGGGGEGGGPSYAGAGVSPFVSGAGVPTYTSAFAPGPGAPQSSFFSGPSSAFGAGAPSVPPFPSAFGPSGGILSVPSISGRPEPVQSVGFGLGGGPPPITTVSGPPSTVFLGPTFPPTAPAAAPTGEAISMKLVPRKDLESFFQTRLPLTLARNRTTIPVTWVAFKLKPGQTVDLLQPPFSTLVQAPRRFTLPVQENLILFHVNPVAQVFEVADSLSHATAAYVTSGKNLKSLYNLVKPTSVQFATN